MDSILLIPRKPSDMLKNMINSTIENKKVSIASNNTTLINFQNKKIILAIELDEFGFYTETIDFIKKLYKQGFDALKNSSAIILIHSSSDLYTKSCAQNIIFHMNQLGCSFIGHPLIEAIGNLRNFLTMQKVVKSSLKDVCLHCCKELGKRFFEFEIQKFKQPKISVLHSSNPKTSNTISYWNMIKKELNYNNIEEIHIENGAIRDCHGCPFTMCLHYGKQKSCFYGGFIVDEVYPAILDSDIIIWLCPNYNDALSANLTAVVNRLTAIYRTTKFYNKIFYAVIVSGNSGSDTIAKQLISALNMNKSFYLPPYFCTMATANDHKAIFEVPNIYTNSKKFAQIIHQQFD